ncbi:MAG: hypothetical protein BRD50_06535 [Bacteroidetes bacterium SW_11_45_7]|nr:MAG: hypothetical protein BRD50_06535 [Bacteroidetes bacterium SW_11_45_7]
MQHESLKLELIEWLTSLTDESTLEYLKEVKDAAETNHDWWHDLTDEQKQAIERGMKDVEEGRVTSHEQVKKKYGL